jgi:hypothetical protein
MANILSNSELIDPIAEPVTSILTAAVAEAMVRDNELQVET